MTEREKTHSKHTRRNSITTVRHPEREEAAGRGGDRSQMAYEYTPTTLFTTILWPPLSGADGTDDRKGKVGTC